MKRPRIKAIQAAAVGCFGLAFLLLSAQTARTYPPFLSKAKSLGMPAKDCTYCHVNAAGGEPYNARGKWLIAEKQKRGASAVDVAWLKEYGKGGRAKSTAKAAARNENTPAAKEMSAPETATSARPAARRGGVTGAATVAVKGREPARALSGRMMGNEIATRLINDRPGFNYVLTRAQVVNGKLQFEGMVKPIRSGGAGSPVTATLVGTLSRARNPWPSANDGNAAQRRARSNTENPAPAAGQTQPQGRETRNPENTAQLGSLSQSTQPTARTTQTPTAPQGQRPSAGEANEQTQSLYSSADVGLGCEIVYLKVQLPPQLAALAQTGGQPVQVGVVLAPIDNKRGEEINNQLCRVVHALNAGGGGPEVETALAQLNRLLSGGTTPGNAGGQ